MPSAATWMDLENTVLCEVSQRQIICYHLWNLKNYKNESIQKYPTNLLIKQNQIHRYRKQTYGY